MARSRVKVRITTTLLAQRLLASNPMRLKGYTVPEDAWVAAIVHVHENDTVEVYLEWFDHGLPQAPVREGGRTPEAELEPAV